MLFALQQPEGETQLPHVGGESRENHREDVEAC